MPPYVVIGVDICVSVFKLRVAKADLRQVNGKHENDLFAAQILRKERQTLRSVVP